MKVSAITIARNAERYLGEALRSILAQTLKPAEILLVVDESTDRTLEVARSFPDVRVLNGPGRGIAGARNTGIAAAAGELIAFLDSDDLWCPSKLRTQASYMAQHPEMAYTTTLLRYVADGFSGARFRHSRNQLQTPVEGSTPSALMARREAFQRVGGFDPAYPVGADSDWFARARDLGLATALLPHTLLFKRLHAANTSGRVAQNRSDLFRIARQSIRRRDGEA